MMVGIKPPHLWGANRNRSTRARTRMHSTPRGVPVWRGSCARAQARNCVSRATCVGYTPGSASTPSGWYERTSTR